MTGLEGFSDWVLALLPRLFLYPGGVGMLVALVALRLAQGGVAAIRPLSLAAELIRAPLPSLALAWGALALLPLPGAPPLPTPVDTLVLVALVLISFSLDGEATFESEGWISAGMALAVLSSVIRGHALMGYVPASGVSNLLAMICVAIGLARLSGPAQSGLAVAVRWLVWVGLGFRSLLSEAVLPEIWIVLWVAVLYAFVIVVLGRAGRFEFAGILRKRTTYAFTIVVWSLATLSLIAALLEF